MADLFEQVLHHLEGSETQIQNWQTLDGIKTVEVESFGPDRWIESVRENGRLMAIDCLALILFTIAKSFDLEQERRIVEGWAKELRNALSAGEIEARDPVTLLALETPPDGWGWLVSMADADKFIAARGMEWRFDEIARHLFNDHEQAIRGSPHWMCDTEQPAAAQTTETAAPEVPGSVSKAPVRARRDLLTPVIEAAPKECGDQFDAPAVWASLLRMASAKKHPLLGVSDEGIKWQNSVDDTQFLSLKNLRERLQRRKKKAL